MALCRRLVWIASRMGSKAMTCAHLILASSHHKHDQCSCDVLPRRAGGWCSEAAGGRSASSAAPRGARQLVRSDAAVAYAAPEMLRASRCKERGLKADVYSVGRRGTRARARERSLLTALLRSSAVIDASKMRCGRWV